MKKDDVVPKVPSETTLADSVVIRESILCLQICSRLPEKEAIEWGEGQLCGTTHGWKLSTRDKQGVECKEYPNRKHYLFDKWSKERH